MLLRYMPFILVLACVGCESTTMNHRASNLGRATPPSPTLTSFPQQANPEDQVFPQEKNPPVASPQSQSVNPAATVDPFPTVYFPFDSWEINSEVRSRLDATAGWMNRYPHSALTIEGHTDVRGTESYNMVLGAKRAQAVKEYLSNLGIPPQRMGTVSYGKELILCDVDDEKTCHQYNRRADMLLE